MPRMAPLLLVLVLFAPLGMAVTAELPATSTMESGHSPEGLEATDYLPTLYDGEVRPDETCMISLLSRKKLRNRHNSSLGIGWVKVLIHIGEEKFESRLLNFGINPVKNSSQVHDEEQPFKQAFLLALSSLPYPREIIWKSVITFASHWWDDLVDRPDGIPYERLEAFVANGGAMLTLGPGENPIPEFAALWSFISESPNPASSLRAFLRITYGGLIQRAPTREKRDRYLKEYRDFSLRGVDAHVRQVMERFPASLFWMTTKTVFELMLQPDLKNRRSLSVQLDCLFSLLLFYQDSFEEMIRGEMNFSSEELPSPQESVAFLQSISDLMINYELDSVSLRVQQLKYTYLYVQARLPSEVAQAYKNFLNHWSQLSVLVRDYSRNAQVEYLMQLKEEEVLEALRTVIDPVGTP